MVVIALAALLAGYAVPNFTALYIPSGKGIPALTKVLGCCGLTPSFAAKPIASP